MELQLGSGGVDFLVRAYPAHDVKWVLTAIGSTRFQEEFAWSGQIVLHVNLSAVPSVRLCRIVASSVLLFNMKVFSFLSSHCFTHALLKKSFKAKTERMRRNYKRLNEHISLPRLHTTSKFMTLLIGKEVSNVVMAIGWQQPWIGGYLKKYINQWIRVATTHSNLCFSLPLYIRNNLKV